MNPEVIWTCRLWNTFSHDCKREIDCLLGSKSLKDGRFRAGLAWDHGRGKPEKRWHGEIPSVQPEREREYAGEVRGSQSVPWASISENWESTLEGGNSKLNLGP